MGLLRTEVATASTSNAGESERSLEFETTPPRAVGDLEEPKLAWESLKSCESHLEPSQEGEGDQLLSALCFQHPESKDDWPVFSQLLLRSFLQLPREASLTAQRTLQSTSVSPSLAPSSALLSIYELSKFGD